MIRQVMVFCMVALAASFYLHSPFQDNKDKYKDSIFMIQNDHVLATAFAIKHSGSEYLVTNAHVCLEMGPFWIFRDGSPVYLHNMFISEHIDLCVFPVNLGLKDLELASGLAGGEEFSVIGYPRGVWRMSEGSITGTYYEPQSGGWYYTSTARIDHGSSGSPCLAHGKVIGVINAMSEGSSHIPSFFVSVYDLNAFLDLLNNAPM